MTREYIPIRSFRDLEVWKFGHRLVLAIYQITKYFPKEESFCLTSQMRRAAISFTSNIAEGFSRTSVKDKVHFYTMAKGSLTELLNQLLISRDVGYINYSQSEKIENDIIKVLMIHNRFLASVQGWEGKRMAKSE